ncbi:MAG TPA: hypothetical protein VE954_22400 [Oligoflexus sp.]|uniref:hypothetical protein n=1 Tax=Oligoflexus sp. TaxID=1971216 RepID=UPI002D4BD904|nr:hypothetical protein [Oligoflexus sp.]HYX35860.1 hypothetical protein [Oligoflexus sp.]
MGNSSSAQKLPSLIAKEELDVIFLRIFESLSMSALAGAAACTGAIFELSANYMDKPAFESLRRFYDLYFSVDIDKKKDEVNDNVDDIVSTLQARLAAGETLDAVDDVDNNEELKKQRLSLSAVQKQLEGLIVLDSGIKEQVLPALASMQFEDAIRQRLAHVVQAWWKVGDVLHKDLNPNQLEEVARELAKMLSSVDETKTFYELVLNEPAPEGQDQRSIFIEF